MKVRSWITIVVVIVVALLTVVCGTSDPVSDSTVLTPLVEAVPTTIVSGSPFVAGLSFIQKGQSYRIHNPLIGGRSGSLIGVVDVLADGWVEVGSGSDVTQRWLHLPSGRSVTSCPPDKEEFPLC